MSPLFLHAIRHRHPAQRRLAPMLLLLAFFLLPTGVLAADEGWVASTKEGRTMARTPEKNWVLVMRKPNEGLWGLLYIESNPEQIERLKKVRLVEGFNFFNVVVEIEDFQRELRARYDDKQNYLAVDIDVRAWEQIKVGKRMRIRLPDGTEQEDTLRNSDKIMRQMESETL